MFEPVYSHGLLALELRPDSPVAASTLTVAEAARLGDRIAEDLRAWVGPHADVDIALSGALYDPVEILRPGWPVHAELARLCRLAPRSAAARRLSFGTDRNQMPAGLQPDPAFTGGPLRWLPFVLAGPGESMRPLQATLETDLLERGMAGAGTALCAQELFAAGIEHARYMTLHDGVAMMAMQYGHNGLAAVWPLIETALFAPQREAWLDAPPEPLVFLSRNIAHIALLDYHQWARMQADAPDKSGEQLETRFLMFEMRQRQIAALLQAHGLEVHFDFCPDAGGAREVLQR